MKTIGDLRRWALEAPAGTTLPASALVELLGGIEEPGPPPTPEPPPEPTWRTQIWTIPSETRLNVAEVAEALGRPRSYVYARTGPKAEDPIPHRKLDGSIAVTAGELRAWIRSHEVELVGGPMEPPAREAAS